MSYESTILARLPVAYLDCQETTGATFADATGNSHSGMPTGQVTPGGGDGPITGERAAQLVGTTSNANLALANPTTLPVLAPYTWEFWLRYDAQTQANNTAGLEAALADGAGAFSGELTCLVWNRRGTEYDIEISAEDVLDGNVFNWSSPQMTTAMWCWHHWCFTYDGSSIGVYLDGRKLEGTSNPGALPASAGLRPQGFFVVGNLGTGTAAYVNHVAVYARALTAEEVAANHAAAMPRQDWACFQDTVRLVHADGTVDWEHDSATFRLKSRGADVLVTPLRVLGSAPPTLMGQDPATGLPAFCPPPPLPPTALSTYVAPVAPALVPAGPTADTVRCGAAHQMATRLTRLYNIVRAAVGAALDVGGPLVASAIVDIALDMLTEGTMGTWIAANGDSYKFMKIVLGGAITALEQGLLPALDATATHALVNAAYDALPAGQTPITVTQAALDQWATNIGTNSAAFLGAADTTLRLLVPTISVDQWQQEINTGSQYPSSDCA